MYAPHARLTCRAYLLPLTALLVCARTSGDMPAAPQALEPEVSASEGGTATLRCLFRGNPLPKITWRFRAHTIDGSVGRHRLMSDGALEIVSLYRNDTGVYICVAENGLGVAMQVIQLVVNGGDSEPFKEDCNELNFNCIYGVEKNIGTEGCEGRKCKPSPCEKTSCEAGQRCVVQRSQTPVPLIGQEPLFTATCGTMLKAGVCPTEVTSPHKETCSDECKDDADCRGVGKCCQRGCSHLCLAPVEQTSTHPLPTTAFAPASGLENEGCPGSCRTSVHGCCQDNKTPAHGPDFEGCCLLQAFGCCPDNRKPAKGPRFEGCGCQYALHGCCPDNVTIAQGPDNQGCGCQYTQHGCCPDRQTAASGPNSEGCTCKTYQFGCCADGVTIAKGPEQQGCHCRESKFGCCGDGETPATGPGAAGCCSFSQYGCCPDDGTEAVGPKFLGCTDAPEKQAACSMSTDPGPCHNFTAMWYYDMVYGGCSRFWYGGCDGNGNRFGTKEECEDVCVQPSPKDVCKLPNVKGACFDNYQRWHYNSTWEQCIPFRYGGCLGNANNFDTRELCQKQCEPSSDTDQCNLPINQGSCAGNYSRWGFNSEAHRCDKFIWGGCEGNSNKFSSETACQIRCVNKQSPQCMQPQETGNCTKKEAVWSFSQSEDRCLPFYYSGCGGNDNRFRTRETCKRTCPSAYDPVRTAVGIAGDENAAVIGKLGHPFQLHCRPYGDPPPRIAWYRNHEGSPLLFNNTVYEPRGNVLLIRRLTLDHLGRYTCKAIYREGRAASRVIIVQAYRPGGLLGDNEFLISQDMMTPTPGTEQPSTGETIISTATTEAPTTLFTDPVRTAVGIAGDENAAVIGKLGHPFQLHCRPYGDPPHRIAWYRNHEGSPLLFNNTVYEPRGNVLLIRRLTLDYLGRYTCKAIYREGRAASRVIIVQAYRPGGLIEDNEFLISQDMMTPTPGTQQPSTGETTISTDTTEAPTTLFTDPVRTGVGISGDENAAVIGKLGHPFQLHCRSYGDPPPRIAWYRNHEGSPLLFNNTVYEPRGNVLLIRRLTLDHLGRYTCKAINREGRAASRVIIVQAYRLGGLLGDNEFLISQDMMTPTPGTQQPSTGETTFSTATTEAPTTLFTDPVRTAVGIAGDENAAVIGKLGHPFQLHCRPYGDPPHRIAWYRNHEGSPLLFNNTVYEPRGNVLLIRRLTLDYLGRYTCKAIYREGRAASRVIIVQAYRPGGLIEDNEFLISQDMMTPTPGTQQPSTGETTISTATTEAPTTLFTDPVRTGVGISGDENAAVIGKLGHPFQLHCRSYGDPPPRIAWYRNHEGSPLLFNNTVYEPRGNVLLIRRLTLDHLGRYTCKAINREGRAASRVIIVQAYRLGGLLGDNEFLISQDMMTPTPGTQQPSTGETTFSTATTEAPTTLFTDPVRTAFGIAGDENAVVTGELGRPLQLHCRPYGNPQPYMTWYRGHAGSALLYNNTVYEPRGNVLLIRSLDTDTVGRYTCEALYREGRTASRGIIVQAYKPVGLFNVIEWIVSRGTMAPTPETPTTDETTISTATTEAPEPLFTD